MPKEAKRASTVKKLIQQRSTKPLHREYLEHEVAEEETQQQNAGSQGRRALKRVQKKMKVNITGDDYNEDDEEEFLDSKTTQRIESAVKRQQVELEMDDDEPISNVLEIPSSGKDNKKKATSEYVEIELEEDDENALNFFLGKEDEENRQPINISEMIIKKIKEKEV